MTVITQKNFFLIIEKHNQSNYGKHIFTAVTEDWKLFFYCCQ